MPGSSDRQTIMLIDGFGLIFRAYHAIDPRMATASGEQTNAVFGFARMLLDVLDSQRPDYAVVALEGGRTFRHDEFDGYKANRGDMPEDLRLQVRRVRELINAFNIPIEQRDGYEADDVIGSLATVLAREAGLRVLIVTGDSDLLQLVEDHIEVVLPGRPRFQDLRHFDLDAVTNRYGFEPGLIPDFKALVGDTSDNIPGVPGVGEKTATALLTRFGSVESILEHLDGVTPPRAKAAIEANLEQLHASKRLATIVRDLDIPSDLDASHIENFDREAVIALFRELEFRSLVGRIPAQQTALPAIAEPVETHRSTIRPADELRAFIERMRAVGTYALDVETTSTDPMMAALVGISIAVGADESAYIPLGHQEGDQFAIDDARALLNPVLGDPSLNVLAHHGKYDLQVLQRHGFSPFTIGFDTMIAAFLLGEQSIGLKDLAFNRLGIQMTEIEALIGSGRSQLTMDAVPVADAAEYACGDVEVTYALADYFRPRLAKEGLDALFTAVELPLIPILTDMERAGIAIDVPYLGDLAGEIRDRMGNLQQQMVEVVGREVNVNSNRQLATLLFDELKLKAGRRTKTGYSVDADVLESIKGEHPVVDLVLEYKSLGKLASTYVESLPKQVNPRTGRVHTSYNQTVAATGRLSSTNPNLQNIPIRTELGRRVRRAFVADRRPDHKLFDNAVLLSADYSQIELRLMAHLSGEAFLVDAFRAGEDIHAATAGLVYGVDQSEVTSEMRRVAKTVNFGLLYGMQAFGLSRDTGLSRADAQRFIDQYWSRLPEVKRYFERTLEFGSRHGYVETIDGRRRYLPELNSPNGMRRAAAERMAINMPVQGTAADIMKASMIDVAKRIEGEQLQARILLQVHDELLLEVAATDLASTARLVCETMSGVAKLDVPLVVDAAAGPNWEELEGIET